jgi:hypothetical protein
VWSRQIAAFGHWVNALVSLEVTPPFCHPVVPGCGGG